LDGLEAYFAELSRWNRKINLTAFDLGSDGSDEAVDRLLIEPLLAVKDMPRNAERWVDIGSGGGSPAIPIALARPDLALTMTEVKVRKSVFLRQVARHLALPNAVVENARFEELLTRPDLHENVDVVTVRAVKLTPSVLLGLQAFLRPGGRLLNFTTISGPPVPPPPLRLLDVHTLAEDARSRLAVFAKERVGPRST
jgi:16S rRNA (guanine527-N7)-methyltransferase